MNKKIKDMNSFSNIELEELSVIDFNRVISILKSCRHEGQIKGADGYYKLFVKKWCNDLSPQAIRYTRRIFLNEVYSLPFLKDKTDLGMLPNLNVIN